MTWFVLAFTVALLTSAMTITEKRALRDVHAAGYAVAHGILIAILFLILAPFIDFPELTWRILWLTGALSVIAGLAAHAAYSALEKMEVSLVSPMFNLTPLLTTLLATLFLDEVLGLWQYVGIGVLVVGTYLLNMSRGDHFFGPLVRIWRSQQLHLLLWSSFLYSITSVGDRYILTRTELGPVEYQALVSWWLALLFCGWYLLKHGTLHPVWKMLREKGGVLAVPTLLNTAGRGIQAIAVSMAPVGPVVAVKRLSTLLTTIAGGTMFHEHHVLQRAASGLIMLIGIFLVAFG